MEGYDEVIHDFKTQNDYSYVCNHTWQNVHAWDPGLTCYIEYVMDAWSCYTSQLSGK